MAKKTRKTPKKTSAKKTSPAKKPVNVLEKIAAYKRQEVAQLRAESDTQTIEMAADMQPAPRGFIKALKAAAKNGPALIAEVKKASPSKDVIREDFHPTVIARAYEKGGATCLSVLTDTPSFQGNDLYLKQAKLITELPALRKDFMVDPIQITQSRMLGADAILIIMAMVDDELARDLKNEADRLGMDALVEVHTENEMYRATKLGAKLVGINNRDLTTFKTDLETFKTLAPMAPRDAFLVAESGINTNEDVAELTEHGAQGFLVGESLMRQEDVELAVRKLMGTT